FARSTLERARRRFGGDREQAASNGHGAPPATATAQHEQLDEPAIAPHDTATPADFGASAETVEHPLADSLDFDEPAVAGPAAGEEVAEEEPAPPAEPILPDEPASPDEMVPDEPLAHDEPIAHDEPAPLDEMVLPDDSVAHRGP